jgi:histidinol dehydrogenase
MEPPSLTPLDLRHQSGDIAAGLPRPQTDGEGPVDAVRAILDDVRARGDAALLDLTERFDGVRPASLRVAPSELDAALAGVSPAVRQALEVADAAIRAHHEHQRAPDVEHDHRGIRIRTRAVPVGRAGCYVPGGRAVYPSTVLMTATIARVAGVDEIVLCVPPDRETGRPPAATLAAAAVARVDEVYAVGGAQAIGAMAYGTDTIRPVDVIVGPGNVYVAVAKRLVAGEGRVGVPSSFAGPSEVVVVADAAADPTFAAIDLLVQAEHGPDGLAWLVTWDAEVLAAVNAEVTRLAATAVRRDDIAANLSANGYAVLVDGPEQAMAVANALAPEHLELMVADTETLVKQVRNAGAVFVGPWSPASLGDYVAGPSHVLPTFGSARFGSALTVADFVKQVHIVEASAAALADAAPHVVALAEAEGLPAHADSMRLRTDRR